MMTTVTGGIRIENTTVTPSTRRGGFFHHGWCHSHRRLSFIIVTNIVIPMLMILSLHRVHLVSSFSFLQASTMTTTRAARLRVESRRRLLLQRREQQQREQQQQHHHLLLRRHDHPSASSSYRYANSLFCSASTDEDDDDDDDDDEGGTKGGGDVVSYDVKTTMKDAISIVKASLLIAGTTVGGGFLALPTSVVVPVGGFVPSAMSMIAVWVYLGTGSLILTDCIVRCHHHDDDDDDEEGISSQQSPPTPPSLQRNATLLPPTTTTRTTSTTTTKSITTSIHTESGIIHVGDGTMGGDMIGIPRVARRALGAGGSVVATSSLVALTVATLVSQLSRAATLWIDTAGWPSSVPIPFPPWNKMMTDDMIKYRLGCVMVSTLGAIISFGGGGGDKRKNTSSTNTVPKETKDFIENASGSWATNVHAILTAVFLLYIVLLFQAGRTEAVWSRCIPRDLHRHRNYGSMVPNILGPIAAATPIMMQLLVYGEILPNVCHMLRYNVRHVRMSVAIGSFVPLVLLTGWAALGVALMPTAVTATATVTITADPVQILLQGGGDIPQRLLILSISAIGTTIIGSFLALRSAYEDVTGMMKAKTVVGGEDDAKKNTRKAFWQNRLVSTLCITVPPTMIAAISPSLFLQAIDFAGSYPILLLYGILPPVMAIRLKLKAKRLYTVLLSLSAVMVTANFWSDVKGILLWVGRCISNV